MTNFQGSGFLIDLPEGSSDVSAYSFVMPGDDKKTAYVTIKAHRMNAPQALQDYVEKEQASLQGSVENFVVSQYGAGKRKGMDVVLTTVEWGPDESRIFQKIAYFLLQDERGCKIFTLTGSDLVSDIKRSGPMFDDIFKSFTPNTTQCIEPGVKTG